MSDKLREAAEASLAAMHDVLEAAYHRCYPECCGRPGMECCGQPLQAWSPDDRHIMDTLGPVEKSLRAALAADADRVSAWQPIETAPKDGTEILLSSPKGGAIANGAWIGLGWAWPYIRREPTHWQLLPAPPALAANEKEPR